MVGGGQQAAADLDPRGVGFGAADQARGQVAIDLGELVLVDSGLAAFILRTPRRPNGKSTAKIAAAVISANTNHSVIKRVPVERRHARRRCAALHHGGKPGN